MQFLRGAIGGSGGRMAELVRHFSRKRSVDLRRINPKVPREEAAAISGRLLQILKDHGPLTVANTWNHVKDAGIAGLNSKTHMKILLKWMTGRKMLKLSCTHVGSAKKFLYSTLPENSPSSKESSSSTLVSEPSNMMVQGKKGTKGQPKKQTQALC